MDPEAQRLLGGPVASGKRHADSESVSGVDEEVEVAQIGGYKWRELGRVGLFLLGALVLSLLAFANVKTQFEETTGTGGSKKLDVFKLARFEDIPRDTMFANFSSPEQQKLFAMFLERYSKGIDKEEYGEMFRTFKMNLDKIDNRNAAETARGGSARHGINKFTGWTDEELSKIRGAKKPSDDSETLTSKLNKRGVAVPATIASYSGTQTAVDWSDIYTTAVRDQGYCGGCWAYSAVQQMESDGIRQGLLTTSNVLSPQQLISCSTDNDGCNGGWTEFAFSYAMETGIELDSDYPYTSYDEDVAKCSVDTSKELVQVDNFYVITSEDSMIDYLMETGPVSACIDSANWDSYVDGIMSTCGTNVDHCVQVVGVDLGEGSYKVRNTWGTDWGEGGYIRLKTNQNSCGISEDPIYTTVSLLKSVGSGPTPKPTHAPTPTLDLPQKPTTQKSPTAVPTQKSPTPVPSLAAVVTVATAAPTPAQTPEQTPAQTPAVTPAQTEPATVAQSSATTSKPSMFPTLLPTLQPSLPAILPDAPTTSLSSSSSTTTTSTTKDSDKDSDSSKSKKSGGKKTKGKGGK